MKRLAAAVMFLTRLPVPGKWEIGASDVGRSMIFFPLVGAAIGALQCGLVAGATRLFFLWDQRSGHVHVLPVTLLAVIIVALGALITGALHLDGLADMADGFGGGRSAEQILSIMRDHAIGSYGAVALVLVLALKIAGASALIEHGGAYQFLLIAPVVARGSVVALGFALPYAREADAGIGGATQHISLFELFVSSAFAIVFAIWIAGSGGGIALAVTVVISLWNASFCKRKIQGITGDTLGANVEICEALVLATGALLYS